MHTERATKEDRWARLDRRERADPTAVSAVTQRRRLSALLRWPMLVASVRVGVCFARGRSKA